MEFCFVFENRKLLFPIDSRIKIVLLGAAAGSGPTDDFAAAFITGKDAGGRDRAIGLPDLPATLTALTTGAPRMTREQVATLSPHTLAFPELLTPLDAEIAVAIAMRLPALNLDGHGWGLRYCRELDADKDAWRFRTAEQLTDLRATREGLYWIGPDDQDWWPLVEGVLFYHLEYPAEGKEPKYWVDGNEVRRIDGRRNPDGTSVMEHWRVAWRDVASPTNERSAIATVLPPRCAAKDTALTVWGGSIPDEDAQALSALMASFCFDYLVRQAGKTHLKYAAVDSVVAPTRGAIAELAPLTRELLAGAGDWWLSGERRARIDAKVAIAYGLTLREYAAVLSTFPLLDRVEPMLPGEPKSFVTRDLALLSFATEGGEQPPDVVEILQSAGIELPSPRDDLLRLDVRVARYREIGAIPYRPTPKGGRPPTDPALIEAVMVVLDEDPLTAETIADAVADEEATVKKVLDALVKNGECFGQGRGRSRSYYVIEE